RSPGTVYDSDEARNPVDTFHDRDWLATLMMLLGRLEYARSLLAHPKRVPTAAAKVAAALIEDVTVFAREHLRERAGETALAEAEQQSDHYLESVHLATAPTKRGLLGFFATTTNPAEIERQRDCEQLLRELPLVLERYFTMFGASFRGPDSAIQWVTTSGLFLGETRRAIAWTQQRSI
ncbi:MAG: hypothetical protein ACRCZF_16050, partial [Gemmataceae bacterium]